jgi:hypothetical protein
MSLNSGFVVLTTEFGTEELRPNRLAWRSPTEFLLSGRNRRLEIGHVVFSFQSEDDARVASTAVMALGRVEEVPLQPALEEIPAEIRSNVLMGPFLLLMVLTFVIASLMFFISNALQRFIGGLFLSAVAISALYALFDWKMKSGPAKLWFRSRDVKAGLAVEEGDLVTNVTGTKEAFKISKLVWVDEKSFRVSEGKSTFQLIFQSPDDAVRVASMIRIASAGSQNL